MYTVNNRRNKFENGQTESDHVLTKYGVFFGIVCFLTALTQMPNIVDAGLSSQIARIVWTIVFVISLFVRKRIRVNEITPLLIMAILLIIMNVVQRLFSENTYVTALTECIFLSMYVYVSSVGFHDVFTGKDIDFIANMYSIASVLAAGYLLLFGNLLRGLSTTTYAYGSKNSLGVVLFTAIILLLNYGFNKGKLRKIISLAFIAELTACIFLMKTRAMIVCFPVLGIIYMGYSQVKRKAKVICILALTICVILLVNKHFYDIIINQILFNNRGHSFAEASSGRGEQWLNLFYEMRRYPLIGDGKTERESLILTALIQFGLLGGIPIILYSLWPLRKSMQLIKFYKSKHVFCLFCISVAYFVDSIFEQLAPFGPGVRCFFLWLLFGILMTNDNLVQGESV